jgi:hypothetical protein
MQHKRDVDPVEDGCIAGFDATLHAAGQCELKVSVGGKKLAGGALVVKSVELTANSQCPGFLDAEEGVYENTGGLTTAEASLGSTKVPGKNIAQSCVTTTAVVKLAGVLSRKGDGRTLSIPSAQLTLSGQFTSRGDVGLACPAVCTANCLPQHFWVDPATQLKWENPRGFMGGTGSSAWVTAYNYCAGLTTGGVAPGTWRMPTINELRTLIRNNPNTKTGGSCKVSETCRSLSCDTQGCTGGEGDSSCSFIEPTLSADCSSPFHQWSATPVTDQPGSYWSVGCYNANVWWVASSGGVRCVR